MYEIKTEDVYEYFGQDKDMFHFRNFSTKSKYYDDSNKLGVGKIKDKTAGVPLEEFVGLKPRIYFFLVDDSTKNKKAKEVKKNAIETIRHDE